MPDGQGRAYNTHDQLVLAGGGIAITPMHTPGRSSGFYGWGEYRVGVGGKQISTDPDGPWYTHGKKVFGKMAAPGETPQERTAAALQAAKDWVAEKYGEPGPWKRNRHRAYVPARINDAHPMRKGD
jgi:hypothetical protein